MDIANLSENLLKNINEIAVENKFSDYNLTCEQGSKNGDGFIASIISVIICGNKKQLNSEIEPHKLALICKTVPTNEARRELFNSEKIFSNEIFAYNNLLPTFAEFQKEKRITNADGFIQFPRAHRAVSDFDNKQHFIIMEDMRAKGYDMWNKLEPITQEHVQLIMTTLGRYHGLSFALRDQKPEIFNSFRPLPDLFLELSKESIMIKNMLVGAIDKAIGLFDETTTQEVKILLKLKNEFIEILENCSGNNVAEPFSVVNHGDSWNNNFMFKGTKEICLLDWQFVRIASPVLDLSYFMMSSTTKELRDNHFDEFIQIYYDNLAEIIRKCGSDPERLFSFTNLQNELKKFGCFGILLASFLLNVIVTDTKDIQNMDEYSENANQNFETLDFVKVNKKSDEKLKNRLVEVIRNGITYGWIEP